MPPFLAVLFWIWVIVAVVVLVRRRIARRADRRVTDALDAAETPEVPPASVTAPEPVMVTAPVAHAAVAAAPAPAKAAPTPPPGFESPVVDPVLTDRHAHRSAPAADIADALVGIRMPCDLVPLVFDRLATDKITLSTTGVPAEVVGRSLADEVERLGYVVRPMSDREVIATRGVTELRMTIKSADANGRHHDHPTARDDSVVVEIVLS
jgi:hypothetical protein